MGANATERLFGARRDRCLGFGVHTPLQHSTPAILLNLWRSADKLGFDWISVWDHFVPVTSLPGDSPGEGDNHEAVAMHAALAMTTNHARVGCLVYNVSYRTPVVIAKAAATIDHLANGRAVIGLGAGYLQVEYERYGIAYPSAAERSAKLSSTLREIRRLLNDDVQPAPIQKRLPIVVGGGGERRTIPTAATLADGWNIPMANVNDFARKNALLTRCAEDVGRDPAEIERTVSLGLCFDKRLVPERFGPRWEQLAPAILSGGTQEVIDKVAEYAAAGADTVILSLRHPYDAQEVERFANDIMGEFT